MKLTLYSSSKQWPWDDPANHGLSEVRHLLAELRQRGICCEQIDTAELPDEQAYEAYNSACVSSIHKQFRIRQVFGSHRSSGRFSFGRDVPALLVHEEGGSYSNHVYPQQKHGRTITIMEHLSGILANGA